MATDATVDKMGKSIDALLAFDKPELRSRGEWGKFNFDDTKRDFERIFNVVGHLKTLPLQFLPEDIANTINTNLTNAVSPLKQVDDFDIGKGNPTEVRQSYANAIVGTADNLYKQVTPWIPFLAYQKGDVARNIAELTTAVTRGRNIADEARSAIEAREKEMAEIIERAREASASAGAAVFTTQFAAECDAREKSASRWLAATGWSAGTTVAVTLASIYLNVAHAPKNWLEAAPRFFLFALALTATLWCGRMYKAFKHQAAINRHRSLSLQTFRAFTAAASDEQTKNAVLLEATHSIFGVTTTGFLDEKASSDAGGKFVELVKMVGNEKA